MNRLYYGDNLSIMEKMGSMGVDLIYLDPPFKSQQNYNLLYKTLTGKPVHEQAEAFCDTWEMDAEKERIARSMPVLMREYGIEDYYVEFWRLWIQALRHTQPHLLAYLIYMVQRLLHMKVILKPTGSIYLHCDPSASHYIKVMMDGIFGHNNFRNEIIWRRTGAHGRARKWGPIHDTILFYSLSDKYTWNRTYEEYDPIYIEKFYRFSDDTGRYRLVTLDGPGTRKGSSGKAWREIDPTEKGRHWELPPDRALPGWFEHPKGYTKMTCQERLDILDEAGLIYWPPKGSVPQYKRYLSVSEGNPVQDIISDIRPIGSHADERLGYPTQKPIALLKRIIEASSEKGGVVFDPFCGCGTTIYAAHELKRKWIGCDIAILAVRLVEQQLDERYGLHKGVHYEEDGIPNSVASAKALWSRDPFQFEHWSAEYAGGFPTKKTGDKGIDGRIYFEMKKELGVMVLSVKGGAVFPRDVRDLRGVLADEDGVYLGGLITMKEPTKGMKDAAAEAGTWEYQGIQYPRIQILTVKEMVEEKNRFMSPTKIGSKIKKQQGAFPFVTI